MYPALPNLSFLPDLVHRGGHGSRHVHRTDQPPLHKVHLSCYHIFKPDKIISNSHLYRNTKVKNLKFKTPSQNPHRWRELPEAELCALGARQHSLPLLGNLQVRLLQMCKVEQENLSN